MTMITLLQEGLRGEPFSVATNRRVTRSSFGATTPTASQNKAAVREKFDAWLAGTGNPFELLSDNARWTVEGNSMASKAYPSKEAFLSDVVRPLNARMAVGLKPTIRSITAEDDRVIVLFDAQGIARDGEPYLNTHAWMLRMQDGSIVEANAFFDSIAFNEFWSRVEPRQINM